MVVWTTRLQQYVTTEDHDSELEMMQRVVFMEGHKLTCNLYTMPWQPVMWLSHCRRLRYVLNQRHEGLQHCKGALVEALL